MNRGSLLSLCAVSASCLLFFVFAVKQISHASQTAARPTSEPPTSVARTDYPDWPWPRGVHEPAKPDDGQLFHIPGSTKSYTDTGKQGAYNACGQCHLIDGRGKARHGRSSGTSGGVFSAATRRHVGWQAPWFRTARNRRRHDPCCESDRRTGREARRGILSLRAGGSRCSRHRDGYRSRDTSRTA
jgi:hypothetical protein